MKGILHELRFINYMIRFSLVYPGVLSGHGMSKPVILEAMKDTLPEFFYRDIYKSDYSFDLYQDYEVPASSLRRLESF